MLLLWASTGAMIGLIVYLKLTELEDDLNEKND